MPGENLFKSNRKLFSYLVNEQRVAGYTGGDCCCIDAVTVGGGGCKSSNCMESRI